MKIGLVHGRFQPFHNGHKFLVDKMLKEWDLGVILIGSATKQDDKNPFSVGARKKMIRGVYGKNKNLFIGANVDLAHPFAKNAQWDVVFASCVLSLTGYLPTHVYGGKKEKTLWKRFNPELRMFNRHKGIIGTDIKKLVREKRLGEVRELVPREVLKIIKAGDKFSTQRWNFA